MCLRASKGFPKYLDMSTLHDRLSRGGYGERWRVYLASKLKRVVAVGVISYLRFSEQIVF